MINVRALPERVWVHMCLSRWYMYSVERARDQKPERLISVGGVLVCCAILEEELDCEC